MNRLPRSIALKLAAVISVLLAMLGFAVFIPNLFRGAFAVNQGLDAPPFSVIVLGFALSIIRILAAFATWQAKRWGIVLTVLANALDGLSAAPGILFAPTQGLWLLAILDVIFGIIVIMLCLWREKDQGAANRP